MCLMREISLQLLSTSTRTRWSPNQAKPSGKWLAPNSRRRSRSQVHSQPRVSNSTRTRAVATVWWTEEKLGFYLRSPPNRDKLATLIPSTVGQTMLGALDINIFFPIKPNLCHLSTKRLKARVSIFFSLNCAEQLQSIKPHCSLLCYPSHIFNVSFG